MDRDGDYTPEGDEIRTATLWLAFEEGEVGITLDFTKFYAGLKSAEEITKRLSLRRWTTEQD